MKTFGIMNLNVLKNPGKLVFIDFLSESWWIYVC